MKIATRARRNAWYGETAVGMAMMAHVFQYLLVGWGGTPGKTPADHVADEKCVGGLVGTRSAHPTFVLQGLRPEPKGAQPGADYAEERRQCQCQVPTNALDLDLDLGPLPTCQQGHYKSSHP